MEDVKIDLTELTGYIHAELFQHDCSIEFVEVNPVSPIAGIKAQVLRSMFSSHGSDYMVSIESPNAEDDLLHIDVTVTKFVKEDQLPPWESLNDRDRITVCRYIQDWSVVKDPFNIKSYPHDGLSLRLEHIVEFEIKCEKQNPFDRAKELVNLTFHQKAVVT